MAKGFIPFIGLAVVVALAMAAVFGSMSLANPAMAAIGQPGDAGLTERVDSPQGAPMLMARGAATSVNLSWSNQRDPSSASDPQAWFGTTGWEYRYRANIENESYGPWGRDGIAVAGGAADDTSTVTVTIANLTNGQGYQFQVRLVDANGDADGTAAGLVSNTASATPIAAPDGAIPVLTATASALGGTVELKWTYTDGDDVPATGWQYASITASDTLGESHWKDIDGKGALRSHMVSDLAITAVNHYVRPVNLTSPGAPSAVDNATPADPSVMNLRATAGEGYVRLTWNPVTSSNVIDVGGTATAVTHYSYDYYPTADENSIIVSGREAIGASRGSEMIDGLTNGTEYTFNVYLHVVDGTTVTSSGATRIMAMPMAVVVPPTVVDCSGLPMFEQDSTSPGDNSSYTVTFCLGADPDAMTGMPYNLGGEQVNTREHDLVIEFDGDYGVPSTIRPVSVAITTDVRSDRPGEETYTPEDVHVDGEKVRLSLGDLDERDQESAYIFSGRERISVHFRQSAGITTPTEAGDYNLVGIEFGSNSVEFNDGTEEYLPGLVEPIYRKISLSEEDGGLDTTVEAKGKGFKNGTSLSVFRDAAIIVTYDHDNNDKTAMRRLPVSMLSQLTDVQLGNLNVPFIYVDDGNNPLTTTHVTEDGVTTEYVTAPNGFQDTNDDGLCVAASIGGNDIGVCEFKVTHPTFVGGINYVNARDGRSQFARKADTFELKASIIATPTTGSPGERILVQVVDFPANSSITKAELARNTRAPLCTACGSVDSAGAGTFSFIVPNWPSAGTQELRVFGADGVKASVNVTIGGPQITVTPETVLANQRVSLIGTGFSPRKVIANADIDAGDSDPIVSIGGKPIDPEQINDGEPVRVDNGGNWSASVDLPLAEATTGPGERLIRVTDSGNRTGGVVVTIPGREVTITPDSGRVGTIAAVRGTGFPSKNDEGEPVSIDVIYETSSGATRLSATPDASGRFEVQLRIPTTAAIPSSNTLKVSFTDSDGVVVPMTIPHEVPEGIIQLSQTSGGPGSSITVSGEGFKSFVPVSLVRVGSLDITPAPKPSTDGNGMMSFVVTIPGLDVGIQTIEVNVGRTTSSTGFTVTESGVNPGDIRPVAEGLSDLGDNLDVIWHFNNDTKAWTFYDGQDGSDLTHVITGETYLILVKTSVEVILNRNTRSLTCVGGNCWNQIVW